MKILFRLLILFFTVNLYSSDVPSIVFVHLGGVLPKHAVESIKQTRLHNPVEDIYLVGGYEAYAAEKDMCLNCNIKFVDFNTVEKSEEHIYFLRNTPFNATTQKFWIYTTERLLYVHDLMVQKKLENVFQVENDVMVYGSFSELMPMINKLYSSIAIPFANETAAICSVVYFKDSLASRRLADCIARHAREGQNDMRLPGILKEEFGTGVIDHLPILPASYVQNTNQSEFKSKWCPCVSNKYDYCKYSNELPCIFDAVTLGYLLSVHNKSICEGTIFDPRVFSLIWKKNDRGLYIPYMRYYGADYRIFNLHIHNKNLENFRSGGFKEPTSWIAGPNPENGHYVN